MYKKSEILTYSLPDGSSNVEVLLNEDDMWMTQVVYLNYFKLQLKI